MTNEEDRAYEDFMNEMIEKEEGPSLEDVPDYMYEGKKGGAHTYKDQSCGICLEMILERGQVFGLLDKCDHAYCLECIRNWRSTYIKKMTKEVRRACPLCRIESHLVIPSNFYVHSGPEKDEVVEEFKESMGSIPCRLFNYGKGECPFLNSCFYDHRLKDGTPYEYAVKARYYDDEGTLVQEKEDEKQTLADYLNF